MPLTISINLSNDLQILIWDIEESLEELSKNIKLTAEDLNRLKKRKKVINQKGFFAIRKLFLYADINPTRLFYNSIGAPVLKSGKKLSISHSKTVAGIAYGSKTLGFDVECYREKIINIAPRFLHPQEDFATNGEAVIQKLTLIWTAKEALFKALQQAGIIFSKQLLVAPFEWGVKSGSAKVFISDQIFHFSLKFIVEKTYCGTLAISKNP
jgi:phosphopantetheinyl transferase